MNRKVLAFAGLLVAALLVAPKAQAATSAELEAQVQALLSQIAQLQGGASASASCYSYTRDLTVGAQGADVTALQNYLAAGGYFKVAATGYFGGITQAALAAWQSGNGIAPAAGYFGPISRAKYNSMCSTTSGDDDDDTTGDDDDDDDDFSSGNGEEASLEDFDAKSGDDTDLDEGQEAGEILDFKFDVEDADVEVQRVQVNFDFDGSTGEDKPWKVFTGAHLMMDGDEIASIDNVDDEDTWSDEGTDQWSIRFNGVDEVVNAGDTAEFTVAVDVEDSVDDSDTSGANDWTVYIDDNGVRALDEAGIDQYTGDDSDTVAVSIEEAGQGNELNVSEGDDNPEATVLEVDDSETSDWMTVGVMKLSAEGDIELNELPIAVTVSSSTYNGIVNDAQIIIDGQEYNDFSVSAGTTTTATLTFDLSDEDIVIEDGDSVDVEVQLEFDAIASGDEGTTVEVAADASLVDTIDAEGADDGESLDSTQLKGSFEGEEHTLRNEGIMLELVDTSAVSPVGGDEAQANYEMEFTVTAFGEDFFIEKAAERDATADGSAGVEFVIENGSGTEYASTAISVTADLSKDGSTTGDTSTHFKVAEGQTRTFHLLVTLDNEAASAEGAGYYRVQLTGVGFDDGADGTADNVLTTGLDDFETDTTFVDDADAQN
jgi:peptidoglycan hydrolase-like protein with peptidoglycan-binding domain